MKKILTLLLLTLLFQACDKRNEISSFDPVNWDKRAVDLSVMDSLVAGMTYLSVYAQIYSQSEHKKHDLTVTVSMRNTDRSDSIYIEKASYFDTQGKLIRNYFNKPIFIAPMETVEIVIDKIDREGGTGANFFFDWKTPQRTSEPLFEGVMISTSGQQGLSFTTQGKRVQ